MISDMKFRPTGQNQKGKRIFLIVLLLSAATFAVSLFLEAYQGVVQLVSLVGLTVALYFYNRYLATSYEYEITKDRKGTPVFVVSAYSGKRVSTMCCIALWDIHEIRHLSRDEYRADKRPADVQKHTFLQTFSPEFITKISVRERGQKIELIIEANEAFEEYLSTIVSEAKGYRPSVFDDE